jgi:hypothetical protein
MVIEGKRAIRFRDYCGTVRGEHSKAIAAHLYHRLCLRARIMAA